MIISLSKIEGSLSEIKIGLALINPCRIPVHVGLLLYDFFLESTLNGPVVRDRDVFLKWALGNSRGVCLVELVEQKMQKMGVKDLKDFFVENATIDENSTCLDPVVRIVGLLTSRNLKAIKTIFDLVPYLETNRLVKNFYWLGKYPKEGLSIEPYSRDFVINSLKSNSYA